MPQGERVIQLRRELLGPERLVWVILAVLILISMLLSENFLRTRNLINVFLVHPVGLGIASLGQAFVVISGGIDMSVGAAISLLTSLTAGLFKSNPGISPLLVAGAILCLGALLGAINGYTTVFLRVPPFMATLATMSIYQGAALFYAKRTIGGIPREFRYMLHDKIAGYPISFLYFLIIIVICYLILNRNKFGRHMYAVGESIQVSAISGIAQKKVRFLAYVIGGGLVGVAALFLAARLGGGGPTLGTGYELDSITAIVIGGISLSGGSGNIFGAFGGVLIISVFSNLMNMLNVNPFTQMLLKGAVLILAVAFYSKRRLK